ncbi:trehalose 6-phosphate phosphatase [Luteimonas cucumeris]|uniref:Trehalose 6-phosphate phosphatase n=1 Tax=Luteimonas cucumeris TaxID=985012 RepID=A0A562L5Z5_9GAMM|nr:trehalose-phosphatase [Luteimonas cucumeris]TWI02864.1 trehalose 6-phosphate phosphatase [Luteimonas cucumeris]
MAAQRSPQRQRPPLPADDWALFLDVDGCLLDFADTPDGVFVPPALPVRLDALSRRLDGALALVSGRTLASLDRLFAPLQLPAAGLHGLERRHVESRSGPPTAPPALAGIADAARQLAAKYPGTLVEDKRAAIALHWRAEPLAASDFEAFAMAALPQLEGYRLQHGDHVIELRPAQADKGDAIAAFLEEPPFRGRMPVFAGDDLTDEHGFEVVNARGGITVLVGAREPSAAGYHLDDIAAVHAWLGVESGAAR